MRRQQYPVHVATVVRESHLTPDPCHVTPDLCQNRRNRAPHVAARYVLIPSRSDLVRDLILCCVISGDVTIVGSVDTTHSGVKLH